MLIIATYLLPIMDTAILQDIYTRGYLIQRTRRFRDFLVKQTKARKTSVSQNSSNVCNKIKFYSFGGHIGCHIIFI